MMPPPPPGTHPSNPFTLITKTPYRAFIKVPPCQEAIRVARLMALTHNTIFRALNAVWHQAPAIDPSNTKDTTSFAKFALFALDFLENHHRCEELVFFPMLEAQAGMPGLMGENVEQHRAFAGPLRELRLYLEGVRDGVVEMSAKELMRLIDALAPELQEHLHEEIPSILEAGTRLGDEAMRACYKAFHDEAEGTADAFTIGPLVLGCQDNTMLLDGQQIAFPELPFSLVPYLVEYVVSRRHADVWRFCPSTFHGQPRVTEFLKLGVHRRRQDGSA
ncbi:hypothetical protein QBC34DRAFT_464398 [Podospora aff. communis PSN243]|uniref:Hemerythrin-like domain-containing protein n=1 Tax=Podospora aff. communis PSN243 TaxID=3040156 RepID=A0AAV9GKQ2_9PEZI|nr:hypothetical protein QBC34DRAFT_464398 [Podospora aff. communis PSN243]